MSTFKVCFTKIVDIYAHPNPAVERLEIATVYGFQVVVGKGVYKPGDFALLIPVDSILNQDIEDLILGPNPKIKLDKHRVRQIRIQKFPSQGMLVSPAIVEQYLKLKGVKHPKEFMNLEVDIAGVLNITKYEPPTPDFQSTKDPNHRKVKKSENPLFHKFNGLENIKWYPDLFKEGEQVVIQEKLHGSNCRAGLLPTATDTLWKKVLKFFKMLPEYEIVWGSNNVQNQNKRDEKSSFYGKDVYKAVLDKVDAFNKILPNEIIYGELIGEGIQKNYHYGHKGEHHFVLFDVKIVNGENTRWLTPTEVAFYAKDRGFDLVPILFEGPYNKDIAYSLTKGVSRYCAEQKVREGIVIKADGKTIIDLGQHTKTEVDTYNDAKCVSNKKSLKWISEDYLDDKNNTDNH